MENVPEYGSNTESDAGGKRSMKHCAALLAYLFYTNDSEGKMVLPERTMRVVMGRRNIVPTRMLADELSDWGIGMVKMPEVGSRGYYGFLHMSMLEGHPVTDINPRHDLMRSFDRAVARARAAQDPLTRMADAAKEQREGPRFEHDCLPCRAS